NVGAEDLFYSARRLERRANYRDKEYVVSALPLFIMKWNRVVEGLKEFLAVFDKIRPSLVKDEVIEEEPRGEKEIREALLEAVRLGNQSPALKLIDELESVRGTEEIFEQIKEYIKSIEFEKAEALIRDIK
ncbi:MAG: hypothetical protein J5728_04645, partial [Lachnospiraceae bacterium]|nr:hypothetical protein [Lachnospiraceae bacterium]